MKDGPDIAIIASLIGDPARANILLALMNGVALTGSELAEEAGVTLSTTSLHLTKLCGAGLVTVRKHGRHRFFSISDACVAELVESLMGVAERLGHRRQRPSSRASALKCSRVCYDHLAGELGVWMYERLRDRRAIIGRGERLRLTRRGEAFVEAFGIELGVLKSKRRTLCRACRDWSEQRDHLGGSLGSAFLDQFRERRWARREDATRIIRFSRVGEAKFRQLFA